MSIELVNVTKHYRTLLGRHTVYQDFSLVIPRGRNVGIIGRNGAGKSTLLKLIAGTELPDKGQVIRNMSVSWPLGFSGFFQLDLTGTANVKFCARIYDRDPKEMIEFVRGWSGLGKFLDWPVKGYSTGMRGRLGFALSLAIKFDCLLIDEVLSTGDASFRKKATHALAELQSRSSFIMVSHDYRTVERLCDMVIVIGGPEPEISTNVISTVRRVEKMLKDAGVRANEDAKQLERP